MGQGGTPADGDKLRQWADTWQVAMLGARVGLIMGRCSSWTPPNSYVPRREPGNRDGYGGGEKPFWIDGAISHVFVQSSAVSSERPLVFSSAAGHRRDCKLRHMRSLVEHFLRQDPSRAAMVQQLDTWTESEEVDAQLEAATSDLDMQDCARATARFGPGHPIGSRILQVPTPDAETLSQSWLESVLNHVAEQTAAEVMSNKLRWMQRSPAVRQLEVYIERTPCVACFPQTAATLPTGDWNVVLQVTDTVLSLDLEVLAMVAYRIADRRLLGLRCSRVESVVHADSDKRTGSANDEEAAADDDSEEPSTPVYPCVFVHDIRIREAAGQCADGAAVLARAYDACGGLLLEAYEVVSAADAVDVRRFRLILEAPHGVFDDRKAYAVYQRTRKFVREALNVDLC